MNVRLHCPRCRLTITPKADWLTIEHCPRCIARAHLAVALVASPPGPAELYATGAQPTTGGSEQSAASSGPTT